MSPCSALVATPLGHVPLSTQSTGCLYLSGYKAHVTALTSRTPPVLQQGFN